MPSFHPLPAIQKNKQWDTANGRHTHTNQPSSAELINGGHHLLRGSPSCTPNLARARPHPHVCLSLRSAGKCWRVGWAPNNNCRPQYSVHYCTWRCSNSTHPTAVTTPAHSLVLSHGCLVLRTCPCSHSRPGCVRPPPPQAAPPGPPHHTASQTGCHPQPPWLPPQT